MSWSDTVAAFSPTTRRPICTILGGANGSGKSSIYDALRPPGVFLNADNVARRLNPQNPETASLAAGRQVLCRLRELILEQQDFVFETTLSGRQPLDLMKRARTAGYDVDLVFVVLQTVDLHIERVALRVARGGHDIAKPVILRRYGSALARLADAFRLANEAVVMDNTSRQPVELVRVGAGAIVASHLDPDVEIHRRVAIVLARAFDIDERGAYRRSLKS